jgi:hypothetical protein
MNGHSKEIPATHYPPDAMRPSMNRAGIVLKILYERTIASVGYHAITKIAASPDLMAGSRARYQFP